MPNRSEKTKNSLRVYSNDWDMDFKGEATLGYLSLQSVISYISIYSHTSLNPISQSISPPACVILASVGIHLSQPFFADLIHFLFAFWRFSEKVNGTVISPLRL